MRAAFLGTCGHGTERMIGSAPGPAKVATRMVLLRIDFGSSCAGRAPQTGQRAIPFTPRIHGETVLLEDGSPGQARNRRSSLATLTASDLLDVVQQRCKLAVCEGIAAAREDALGVFDPNSGFAEAQELLPHASAIERQRGIAGNVGHGSLLPRGARGDAHTCGPAVWILVEHVLVPRDFDFRH